MLSLGIRLAPRAAAYALFMIGGTCLPAQQSCDSGASYTSPITITRGGTYSGNWQSTDPSVPAVTIRTTQPVIITNSRLKGPGELISANAGQGAGTTLTVQQSCFTGVNPNAAGGSVASSAMKL